MQLSSTEATTARQPAEPYGPFLVIADNAVLMVPRSLAVCPYCERGLFVQFSAWTQTADGSWRAEGCELECCGEPDLTEDSDEHQLEAWDEFHRTHSAMPYVHWLPVQKIVEAWVNCRYRFRND